jgi:hypothetical protein
MAKLKDLTTAKVPGAGTVKLTNISSLLQIFLGLALLALLWGYAQQAAGRARGFLGAFIPGAKPEPKPQSGGKVILQ